MKDLKIVKGMKKYCEYFDLPLSHLVEIMSDLKVIPMLRGKGFEFTVSDFLKENLSSEKWIISNPNINAQSEVHDVDVYVIRKKDNKQIRIECKLAGKDSFDRDIDNLTFKVKCMRSRTISDNEVATRMSKKYGVERKLVLFHADNYREDDFDYVIASMGNSFWTTKNQKYVFECTDDDKNILSKLFPKYFKGVKSINEFKKKVFNFLLIARSKDIKVSKTNNILCTRRKCINNGTSTNCGFIPNYPLVNLKDVAEGNGSWKILSDLNLGDFFNRFLEK
ncbi:hypothetical protein HYU07_03530 [Candidatus Woesearchaeota archaeon]|nr:hypothetical protein [Candidatus Woesearchaeota archaeon]